MVSNLSTIGFSFEDDDAFHEMMQALTTRAFERLACDEGDYAIWRSRTGAEIWFHIVGERDTHGALDDKEVMGLTPFFEGLSDVPIEVVETVLRPGDNVFEGAFLAWVDPQEDTGLGAHQIVFDAVDFAAHCDRPMPFRARARLTGFARNIKILDGEDAASRVASSARGFMAIGLFGEGASAGTASPSSNAVLTGTILESSKLTNEETSADYHWMLVQTADATFDVVAEPQVMPAGFATGAIVQIGCLFFGRIIG